MAPQRRWSRRNIAIEAIVSPSITELYWKWPWSMRISAGWRRMAVVAIATSYFDMVVVGRWDRERMRSRR